MTGAPRDWGGHHGSDRELPAATSIGGGGSGEWGPRTATGGGVGSRVVG